VSEVISSPDGRSSSSIEIFSSSFSSDLPLITDMSISGSISLWKESIESTPNPSGIRDSSFSRSKESKDIVSSEDFSLTGFSDSIKLKLSSSLNESAISICESGSSETDKSSSILSEPDILSRSGKSKESVISLERFSALSAVVSSKSGKSKLLMSSDPKAVSDWASLSENVLSSVIESEKDPED